MIRLIPLPIAACAILLFAPQAKAELHVSPMFGDHMALQRELPVPVWGKADPGDTVIVRFAAQETQTRAGTDGKWLLRLGAQDGRGSETFVARSSQHRCIQAETLGAE